jgi:predicted XRE-type DNA-binding protein
MDKSNTTEIIIYKTPEGTVSVDVIYNSETFWLTQKAIAHLFGVEVPAVSKHLNNIYETGELHQNSTISILETVQKEGKRNVKRKVEYYSLDAIIAVGYRVNSYNATQFRIWATKILKDYLLKGYAFNLRVNRIEYDVEELKNKVQEIDLQINSKLLPTQGVFFDGQIFDAYQFASKIIRSATKSIILIDNYIDETTLAILSKKEKGVIVVLLTNNKNKQLVLDVTKANEQYDNFELKTFTKSHDRFLIIDFDSVYHIGASLKDLGKKWFAFSKMDKSSVESIINSVSELI